MWTTLIRMSDKPSHRGHRSPTLSEQSVGSLPSHTSIVRRGLLFTSLTEKTWKTLKSSLKVRIHGAILRAILRNGWIASCIHPKICCSQYCTQYCSSRISSYFCNIARNNFLRVSTICSISCDSVTQISVFSQSNLTFKFNRWPWYVSGKKMVWTAEESKSEE